MDRQQTLCVGFDTSRQHDVGLSPPANQGRMKRASVQLQSKIILEHGMLFCHIERCNAKPSKSLKVLCKWLGAVTHQTAVVYVIKRSCLLDGSRHLIGQVVKDWDDLCWVVDQVAVQPLVMVPEIAGVHIEGRVLISHNLHSPGVSQLSLL